MADVDLRFHKDMLVLSAPVLASLARLGLDVERDAELTLLLEADVFEDAYRLESLAGAQCLVAPTASLTPARLARVRMEDRAEALAEGALAVVRGFKPQHVLVEIGPCGLPLDGSSKSSLKESRDQYTRAARLFAERDFDAFFLNGFRTVADLKCALMGLRKVSSRPVFASVDVREDAVLASGRGTLLDAVVAMAEYEASVAGFCTPAPLEAAVALAREAAGATPLPLLAQLEVSGRGEREGRGLRLGRGSYEGGANYTPDDMVAAADALRAADVQFLRAVGEATPAYTGALAASTLGLDAAQRIAADDEEELAALPDAPECEEAADVADEERARADEEALANLIARAQARVARAIG